LRTIAAAAVIVLSLLFAGCSSDGGDGMLDRDKSYKLKVLYTDQESFMEKYGYYIQADYPNIELQVVPIADVWQSGSFEDIQRNLVRRMEAEEPDLVFLQSWQMPLLQQAGQLKPLKHLLGSETIGNLHPGVKRLLEREGDGELYSIATTFIAEAVFYNKDLFQRYRIPVPDDTADWKQLLELAGRFPSGETLGFYWPPADPGILLETIGLSEGLSYIQNQNGRAAVAMNTDSWANIAKRLKAAYDAGATNRPDENGSSDGEDLFRKGEAAITAADSGYAQKLVDAGVSFEWGVLPLPSADLTKMVLMPEYLIAINKNSRHAEEAAALIRYIQGDKISRLLYNVSSMLPSSMTSTIAADDSHPLHYMYTRDADTAALDSWERIQNMPLEFASRFHETIQSMMAGKIEVREGLQSIEQFGNEQLQ